MIGIDGNPGNVFDDHHVPLDPNIFLNMNWPEENAAPNSSKTKDVESNQMLDPSSAVMSHHDAWTFDLVKPTPTPQAMVGMENNQNNNFDTPQIPLDPNFFVDMSPWSEENARPDGAKKAEAEPNQMLGVQGGEGTPAAAASFKRRRTPKSDSSSRSESHSRSKTVLVMEGVQIDTLRTITDILYKDKVKMRMEMSQ